MNTTLITGTKATDKRARQRARHGMLGLDTPLKQATVLNAASHLAFRLSLGIGG